MIRKPARILLGFAGPLGEFCFFIFFFSPAVHSQCLCYDSCSPLPPACDDGARLRRSRFGVGVDVIAVSRASSSKRGD